MCVYIFIYIYLQGERSLGPPTFVHIIKNDTGIPHFFFSTHTLTYTHMDKKCTSPH